ncbi:MAG: PepSY domain-containing protein [Gemmatimonadota bacterium]|nr:PepSY domain-containing protein [Gemmatimonadota bacterium]
MKTADGVRVVAPAKKFNVLFWRKWHRWIGFPAALFLLFAAVTGFLVAFTEFFGEEESLREATRDMLSPVTVTSAQSEWSDPLAKALVTARATAPGARIDKIEMQFKGVQPTVTVFTGKPAGGEDRKLVLDAKTGALIKNEASSDKPFLYRLHSGEAFGDGGLVFAMFWALALAVMTVTGLIIYYTMRGRRVLTGRKRVFW